MNNSKKFIRTICIFLGIVVFMTFFSKTIYNFNLPTVTVVLPASGKLVDVIEGNALITHLDSSNIYGRTEGKIKDIFIIPGQEIKKGQVLLELDLNIENIDKLMLDIQKKEQDIELLKMKINDLQADDLNDQITRETNKIQEMNGEIQKFELEIASIEDGTFRSSKKSEYEIDINIAEKNANNLKILFDIGAVSQSELNEAMNSLDKARLQYEQYIQSEKENLAALLKGKREQLDSINEKIFSLEQEQKNAGKNNEYTMNDLRYQIKNAQSELILLRKQLEHAKDSKIISEIDGIVITVDIEKGKFINRNDILIQMADLSNEFKAELILDEQKLELITADSLVEIKVKGIPGVSVGKISTIAPYEKEAGGKHKVTIIIKNSDHQLAGKTADINIKNESEMFTTIVPNGALRKDKNGYYVLVLREENDVLGKNFRAKKVDVGLIDSDSSLSAISGLNFIEPIIITSTSIIDNGSRVKYDEAGDVK